MCLIPLYYENAFYIKLKVKSVTLDSLNTEWRETDTKYETSFKKNWIWTALYLYDKESRNECLSFLDVRSEIRGTPQNREQWKHTFVFAQFKAKQRLDYLFWDIKRWKGSDWPKTLKKKRWPRKWTFSDRLLWKPYTPNKQTRFSD